MVQFRHTHQLRAMICTLCRILFTLRLIPTLIHLPDAAYVIGNVTFADGKQHAFALVNTVNCEGDMGKGIAYQFKLRYPNMNAEYVKKCR